MTDMFALLVFECANCRMRGTAHPDLVLSIPARWNAEACLFVPDPDGPKQPICRACAERALARIKSGDPTLTHVSPELYDPDYLRRAYDAPYEDG